MDTTPASPRGARRSNVALVVAVVALLASTSGTAYAAVVARNSVISSSIKDGQVKYADIAASSVTGSRIKDASVTSADIADGRVTTDDIKDATVGGSDLTSIATVEAVSDPIQDADGTTNGGQHGIVDLAVTCPTGTRILSGGAKWVGASNANNYDRNVYVQASYMDGNGWHARGIVDFGAAGTIRLMTVAYCLTGGSLVLTLEK